jgi:hypothetical protein
MPLAPSDTDAPPGTAAWRPFSATARSTLFLATIFAIFLKPFLIDDHQPDISTLFVVPPASL